MPRGPGTNRSVQMHTKNSPDIVIADSHLCPVTGLQIRSKPEWTDVTFGNKFRMTYSVLGDGILLCRSSGYATLQDAKNASIFACRLAGDAFPGASPYVQIEDYSDFQGGSIEARRFFSNATKDNKRLIGFIFFGATPISRMSINLAKKSNIFQSNLKMAEDYGHAVELALEMLSRVEAPQDAGQDQASPLPALIPERESCHTTGLPVTVKPEWRDIDLKGGGRATFKLIGGQILLSIIHGRLDRQCMELFFMERETVLESMLGPDKPFFELADLSGIKTRHPISLFKTLAKGIIAKKQRTIGITCVNAPLALTLAAKTAQSVLKLPFPLSFEKDYGTAVEGAAAAVTGQGYGRRRRPPEKTTSTADWFLELDGFSARYELLEEDILHMSVRGLVQKRHIKPHFEFKEKVFKAMSLEDKAYFMVVDATQAMGIKAKALWPYTLRARKWQQEHPFRTFIIYGATRPIRSAFYLVRPFSPGCTRMVSNLENALRIIEKMQSRSKDSPARAGKSMPDASGPAREYVNDLLQFIGDIDWEADGFMTGGTNIKPSHPFRPVIDAMEVVKHDLDQLLLDRKAAVVDLEESEEKYRTIVESIEEGYYEVDTAGNFTFFNSPVCRMLGYSRDELLGMNNRECMDKENANKTFLTFNSVYTTGTPSKAYESEFIKKDGSRLSVETSITLMRDRNHKPIGFRGIFRDLTERKAAEKEKERLETRLRYAQRMQSIGTLAAGIAHNFNNLLMGIQGNVSLMLLARDFSDPEHKRLRQVEKMIKSGSELTGQLLGYAREGKYRVKPINLDRLIKDVSGTFGVTRREIRIHLELASDLKGIQADQAQIEQVLLNLYVNAADAMACGGDLFVKAMNATHEHIKNRVYKPEPGPYVLLTVRDTGTGMDKETTERIFDPFFSTKGPAGGTGLGLASAYGIVKGHGGYIEVTSEKGQGTTFEIFLPASRESKKREKDSPEKIFKGNEVVLLVDDEELVIDVGRQMLIALGYRVLTAGSGREAVESYRQNRSLIDLVILDMTMPRMGGGETYDRLKEIAPEIRVLLSSGYSINGQATEILKRGCSGFIQKPFDMSDLSIKIRQVLVKKGPSRSLDLPEDI